MYELAQLFAARERKVLVLTSTHILQPSTTVYAEDVPGVQALWQSGSYAVIGTPEAGRGKLTWPAAELYTEASVLADIILCEADGAKHYPCKLPAAHEPVILPECDVVLAVAGADALGKTLGEACFRYELAGEWLVGTAEAKADVHINAELLARLLTDARGARKNVGSRDYYVVLNKCDKITEELAQKMRSALMERGVAAERIWLRGLTIK